MKEQAKSPESLPSRIRNRVERWRFERRLRSLKGGIDVAQAHYLRGLIGQSPFGARVEVGSYRGKSAFALFTGLPDTAVNGAPLLYCVEPHKPFTGVYGGQFGPEDRGAYYRTMLATGAFRRVALINLSSEVATAGWKEPVGFIFIDGDHTYEGVKRDFDSWKNHLLAGAIVAFDDSLDPNCGPHRLVAELLAGGEYTKHSACGKITTLRRAFWRGVPPVPNADKSLRFLVVCDRAVTTGGLLRFERAGRELQKLGHEIAFCTLSEEVPTSWPGTLPVRRFSEAWQERWDVTICPGAGFLKAMPAAVLGCLRDERFGLRMQHVLSDRSRREAFVKVNNHFSPHLVVFNNPDWEIGTFTEFHGNSFHHLFGACDSALFTPGAGGGERRDQWVIGGQTRKNPTALIAALRTLPDHYVLRLFGPANLVQAGNEDLIAAKRLQLAGEIFDQELATYYQGLNCFVSPETQAGWSNATAEAMASGVPVICTPHGTAAFAEDGANALVIAAPEPAVIAAKIQELAATPELVTRLANAGRSSITRFDWASYARQLAILARDGRESQYFHLPAVGLHGKWPTETRLGGLEPMLAEARGRSVIDLGAGEGFIGWSMLEAGARLVHGFELEEERVRAAQALCASHPGTEFRQANLSDWKGLLSRYSDLILKSYDIVLYLGIHHHLTPEGRRETLAGAAALATSFFAIRTPPDLFAQDQIGPFLEGAGFRQIGSQSHNQAILLGGLWLYERVGRSA